MGGSIAVTVRRANGENIRMCRWTNPLPEFFQNARWLDADETHLDEYLVQWSDMRADFEQNSSGPEPDIHTDDDAWGKWSDKFKLNMTPVYAPHPHLAPHGYGLVVIDYQTKTLAHMQGYSHLLEIHQDEFDLSTEEDATRVRKLLARGCVAVLPRGSTDFKDGGSVPDLDTVKQILATSERPWVDYRFFIDPGPWTVRRFDETPEGFHGLKAAVLELGFKLSDKEKTLWDEFESESYDLEDA